jgi:hypothetical protein
VEKVEIKKEDSVKRQGRGRSSRKESRRLKHCS